jgi:hypothetical protein
MQDRRKFITTLMRGGIFASLTLLTGALVHRWGESDGCRQEFACGQCNVSDGCRLPEADRYRLDKARRPKMNKGNGKAAK